MNNNGPQVSLSVGWGPQVKSQPLKQKDSGCRLAPLQSQGWVVHSRSNAALGSIGASPLSATHHLVTSGKSLPLSGSLAHVYKVECWTRLSPWSQSCNLKILNSALILSVTQFSHL